MWSMKSDTACTLTDDLKHIPDQSQPRCKGNYYCPGQSTLVKAKKVDASDKRPAQRWIYNKGFPSGLPCQLQGRCANASSDGFGLRRPYKLI